MIYEEKNSVQSTLLNYMAVVAHAIGDVAKYTTTGHFLIVRTRQAHAVNYFAESLKIAAKL